MRELEVIIEGNPGDGGINVAKRATVRRRGGKLIPGDC